jgi:hypothetical protein
MTSAITASGDSARHSRLSAAAEATNTDSEASSPIQAVDRVTAPVMRGVLRVDPPVDDAVGGHGDGASGDHRDRDQTQRCPLDRRATFRVRHRGERGQVGERQREDRVLDHHQA